MWAELTAGGWRTGEPPQHVRVGGASVDLSSRDPAIMAYAGWQPVAATPRPPDSDTATWDCGLAVVAGRVTQVWSPRPWTPDELAARADDAASLVSLDDRLAALEHLVFAMLPDPAALPSGRLPSGSGMLAAPVRPGAVVVHAGAKWKNVTPRWLIAGPDLYPEGWEQLAETERVSFGAEE